MTLQEQIRSNRLRTCVVILGFAVLVAVIALILGDVYSPGLLGVVGVVGVIYGLVSYFAAGRIVAATAGAQPITKDQAPALFRAVENAAIAAGIDHTPPVYIVQDRSPNAFAAGRSLNDAYVCATTGLLQIMDERELQGVIAHEMSHVRNRDVQLMSIATVMAGVIALVCDLILRMTLWGGGRRNNQNPIMLIVGIAAVILAPISALMLQMALSRRREYLADASAVELTGDAEGLASALYKLGRDTTPLAHATRATAHMYIENPLRDQMALRGSLGGIFDTHPPLQSRIDRLCEAGGLDPQRFQLGASDPEYGRT